MVVKKRRGFLIVLRVLDNEHSDFCKLLVERTDKSNANYLEQGVHDSNAPRVDSDIGKGKVDYRIERVEDNGYQSNAYNVKGKMNDRRALTVSVSTEC